MSSKKKDKKQSTPVLARLQAPREKWKDKPIIVQNNFKPLRFCNYCENLVSTSEFLKMRNGKFKSKQCRQCENYKAQFRYYGLEPPSKTLYCINCNKILIKTQKKYCSRQCLEKVRHLKDGDKRNRAAREYYDKNKEQVKITHKKWREDNTEKKKATAKLWRQNNPEICKANKAKRRAKSSNNVTASDIEQMLVDQHYMCAYCEEDIFESYQVDHMIPISREGTNDWDNIALACSPCNWSKYTKTAEEFMNSLGGINVV